MEHTFVICAYKESPYLEECINSLKNQTMKSNIIVITSTPNEYIEHIVRKYNLPYYINEGEGGITQDWNFGYQCAVKKYRSRYITIAHQDDIYDTTYLHEIMKKVKKVKCPLIIFTDYYEIRNKKAVTKNTVLKIKRLRIPLMKKSRWMRRRILSLGSPICCPSVTYAVNNLPEKIFKNHYRACEDWEAWEKLSRLKGEFIYVPQILMGHRIHEDSETTASIIDNTRTKEEYQMFCKFWPNFIAKFLVERYSKSQKSNRVN